MGRYIIEPEFFLKSLLAFEKEVEMWRPVSTSAFRPEDVGFALGVVGDWQKGSPNGVATRSSRRWVNPSISYSPLPPMMPITGSAISASREQR